MSKNGFLRSGELARLAGISPDTLRHYERRGLIPCPNRSQNGYREYSIQILERVRLIQAAISVGFTIQDLSGVLRIRDQGGAPCDQVRKLAQEKLVELERRLLEMEAMRNDLTIILKDWDAQLARTLAGKPAKLLEGLATKKIKRKATYSLLFPAFRKSKRNKGRIYDK